MREDMFKVIVNRPRLRRGGDQKMRVKNRKMKDDHAHIGMKRAAWEQAYRVKWLNENLSPLKRFLGKQAGRPWNDVFSEVCANLDTGSTVKMHVREHIDDFVVRHAKIVDGKWVNLERSWRSTPSYWPELYVDPQDGILKRTRELCAKLGLPFGARFTVVRYKYCTPRDAVKRLSDVSYIVRLQGLWYQIQTSKLPQAIGAYYRLRHAEFHELLTRENFNPLDHGYNWEVLHKRSLSKKELKEHGLINHESYKAQEVKQRTRKKSKRNRKGRV